MFIDEVTITVQGGKGGDGKVHFRRDAITAKGGPDGGNGGNGGSIYIQGSHNLNDLRQFRYKKRVEAENGIDGMGKNLFGKNAPDIVISLPIGTVITDTANDKVFEITNDTKKLFVVKGGKGGRGNSEFATPTDRAPKHAEKGELGQSKILHLELKRIADIGFIGLPNAGKSSLLSVVTNATPKIGDYPFTTLEPNIGMMDGHPIADIPGLIEGASSGKGLGIKFLKHIEKTKILLHCIDASHPDVLQAYETVRSELGMFKQELLEKKELVALLKTDLFSEVELQKKVALLKKKKLLVITCSLYDDQQIIEVKKKLLLSLLSESN